MAESYRITAVPTLYTEGEYQGKLKTVTFTAVSANDTRQWFAKNCGHFETVFAAVMPRESAAAAVAALLRGDQTELPGLYREHEFARGFLFEWSPVYFVLPPIFSPREEMA